MTLEGRDLPDQLKALLREWRQLPVDLDQVIAAGKLGPLIIERGSDRHGAILRTGRSPRPVLFRTDGDTGRALTARERFTVAHEIAHAVIDWDPDSRPVRTRDYWRLEDLCNRFAGELLVPDRRLARLTRGTWTLSARLIEVFRLVDEANVSIQVAARRSCDVSDEVQLLGLERTFSAKHQSATLRIAWSAGRPLIPGRVASHLPPDHWIVSWADANEQLGYQHAEMRDLEAVMWRSTRARAIVIVQLADRAQEVELDLPLSGADDSP
ncbi:ImmA/IrrE family metallo-endopeptidase [Microbacterium sp. DT81.1]|uniref:ImmA/IrrE family metallo-endopeptidase n=1 Tax=Microbacterium sp. DT81.1 TaxID=3393413 RepID=UPI003CF3B25E